jgi:hypothetical protein
MRGLLVGVIFALVAQPARAEDGSCGSVEMPVAVGRPHVWMPAGVVPFTGPLEVADLVSGEHREAVVTCVELLPAVPEKDGRVALAQRWAVHLEAPLRQVVRGAHGSCSAPHQMVVVDDATREVTGRRGLDKRCRVQPIVWSVGR